MFYACIKGFYWTHVSAFLNIFNQFWCWYNTALFDTVTLLIFLVFYWRYKKNNWLWFRIAEKKLWSKKFTLHEATSCLSSQNLTCPTPLQFVAISPVKISKGCCHFVPKNHSNIPLCSSSSQSSISYFSCTVLKSIK